MKIDLEIPDYNSTFGFTYNWEDNFRITIENKENTIIVKANKEGLLSLANHFLNLAQDAIPKGYHIHLDNQNSLEEDSLEIIIEKV